MTDPLRAILEMEFPGRCGPAAAGEMTWGRVSVTPDRSVTYGIDINYGKDFVAFLTNDSDSEDSGHWEFMARVNNRVSGISVFVPDVRASLEDTAPINHERDMLIRQMVMAVRILVVAAPHLTNIALQ